MFIKKQIRFVDFFIEELKMKVHGYPVTPNETIFYFTLKFKLEIRGSALWVRHPFIFHNTK